jgi:CHAT domain-containing protein/tetratricopeptide (TPR) repeat protein
MSAMAAMVFAGVASAEPPAHECDRLAAHPLDAQSITPGVAYEKLNPDAAIAACLTARKTYPGTSRFIYQHGRALLKAGDEAGARIAFKQAGALNHAQAWLSLGQETPDPKAAARHTQRGRKFLEELARSKDAPTIQAARAAHMLGLLLLTSKAIPQNPRIAYRWIRRAAKADYAPALADLARLQHRGVGTKANPYAAEKSYRKAIALGQTGLRGALGNLYRNTGRPKKAEATFLDALAQLEADNPIDSPKDSTEERQALAGILAPLGNVQVRLRRFAEAVVSLERALSIIESDPKRARSAFAAAVIAELGKARLGEDKFAMAESLFERALTLSEALHGRESLQLTPVLVNLAKARHQRDRPVAAESALLRALAIQEAAEGPEGAGVLHVLQELRWVYFWLDTTQTGLPKPGLFRDKLQPLLRRLLSLEQKLYSPKHPFLALTLHQLAKSLLHEGLDYYGGGDIGEAPGLLRRALEIATRTGPDSIADPAEINSDLLRAYQKLGDHRQALALLQQRLAAHESGTQHLTDLHLARLLFNLAGAHLALGDPVAAEPSFDRAMSVRRKTTPDPAERARKMYTEAHWQSNDLTGRKHELMLRGALESLEEQTEPEPVQMAEALLNLGLARLRNGDPRFQAILERFVKIALILPKIEKSQEVDMLMRLTKAMTALGLWDQASKSLAQINAIGDSIEWRGLPYERVKELHAEILLGQGRPKDALPFALDVLEQSENYYPSQSTFLLPILKLVGQIELARGALDSAETYLRRARDIATKNPNSIWAQDIELIMLSAERAYRSNDIAAGDSLMAQAKAITAKTGLEGFDTAKLYTRWAVLLEAAGDFDKAVLHSRQGAEITKKIADRGAAASVGLDATRRTNAQYAIYFQEHVRRLMRLTGKKAPPKQRTALDAEIFDYVQRAQSTGAAAAINRMAARFAARDDALGRLIRSRQDVVNQRDRLARKLGAVFDQAANERTAKLEERLRISLRELDDRLAVIDKKILTDFPDYGELARPRPASLDATQSLLRPKEGLLTFMLAQDGGVAFLVIRDQVFSHRITVGRAEIAERVQSLRWGLDPSEITSMESLFEFDAREAHDLFKTLLGPLSAPVMKLSHLIVVPDGPLQSLPLGVLLTAPPPTPQFGDFSAFREAPWLARDVAISVLPAVSGLRALRRLARPSGASKPFLGVGDPLLRDHPGPMETPNQNLRGGAVMSWLAQAPTRRNASALFRGGRADINEIKALDSLPESAVELTEMAASLGGSTDDLYLRERAVESKIRGGLRLRDYRVLALATHGVLAGELVDLSEPALVLTPPDKASDADDGLLTASEITELELDADWVILSACNTAGSDGKPGAEGLSGLARAFFYAGARALFVSHWPVVSETTVTMTTSMLATLAATPQIGKAEAHRRAILALMNDPKKEIFAHPLFWAPFVIVGDGGAI